MSKRTLLLLLAAAIVFAASSAFAALPVAHQAGNNRNFISGDCAACHIPHKAPAIRRGFPINPSAGAQTTYGYIGAFCMERCHLNVSGATGDSGDIIYADTTGSVAFNIGGGAQGALVGSHGLNLPAGANAPGGTTVPTTLPYGAGNRTDPMECTTCHNVHADAFNDTALLQLDIDLLCIRCHIDRAPGTIASDGTWGALYGANNTVGSHPVGTDVNNDSDAAPANSGIRVGLGTAYGSTVFDRPYGITTRHNLGGHLFNGATGADGNSPLSCVTCHAVHGNQTDPGDAQPPTANANVSEDLLVISQGALGAAEPARHASGAATDDRNALCEGCHTHLPAAQATADDWNPGMTNFGHPVDAMATTLNMGNIQTAANLPFWSFGTTTGIAGIGMGTGTNRVLCESCHLMHPNANRAEAGEDWAGVAVAPTGTHILRRSETVICGMCHINTPPGHHPANVPEAPTANFSVNSTIDDDADTMLNCGDCHGGAGAHNWGFTHMPGLKPGWRPNALTGDWAALTSDNGRSLYEANGYGITPTITPGAAIIAYANASRECNDCHTTTAIHSPTDHISGGSTANARYQNWGDGSHFLGATTDAFMETGLYNGVTPFNAETGDWNTSANITMYSKFEGTEAAPQVVCESCHTVRIASFLNGTDLTTRANAGKLLVANYAEGTSTQNTGGRNESGLCEGCHNRAWGAGSTHKLSLDAVDRRSRVGLASGPLTTVIASGLADQAGSPNDGDYSVADTFNCDGCHQPHDANTNAGTMILDVQNGSPAFVPLATGVLAPRSATVTLYSPGTITRSVAADHQWGKGQSAAGIKDSFCSQCHNW